ncbi:DUF805 domain-containing protein [Allosphingosinicella deserti]|uniref:Uncharacterized protein n=1 Tax=Allosphingosinicella deserti TaxID=2116704 RepID=A0A2P7QQW9_9SPHN|nr:hypothetical protein [Sphingomonas deserti]PSJ40363.1 hypothetical protein C7I55_08440 [Sphingomonas deserti]
MGGLSIWHWGIILIYGAAVIWPLALVFRRAGRSGWWSALALLSLPGWAIALWILALGRWPVEDGRTVAPEIVQ